MSLAKIRVVLVRPSHPGNIGGTARAMKNMGLENLVLVSPAQFPDNQATARATDAADILARARVVPTLEAAVGDCGLTIGTSARPRRIDWPTFSAQESAERLIAASDHQSVAVVFGHERTGLTNEELDRCHAVVTIPANPDYPSINLACAVQIMAYEIWLASRRRVGDMLASPAEVSDRVTVSDLDLLYQHLERILIRIGFLDPKNPRLLMRRLVRLFNRSDLDRNELNILRGILTAIEHPERHKP